MGGKKLGQQECPSERVCPAAAALGSLGASRVLSGFPPFRCQRADGRAVPALRCARCPFVRLCRAQTLGPVWTSSSRNAVKATVRAGLPISSSFFFSPPRCLCLEPPQMWPFGCPCSCAGEEDLLWAGRTREAVSSVLTHTRVVGLTNRARSIFVA